MDSSIPNRKQMKTYKNEILQFIADHPIITIFILMIILGTIEGIITGKPLIYINSTSAYTEC